MSDPIGIRQPLVLTAAGLTDRGQRRERNEDSFRLELDDGVLIVADGLGGRPAGDVASRVACEAVFASLSDSSSLLELGERMSRAVASANRAIWERGQANPTETGMGTTVTALVVDPGEGCYGIGHVGDSRAYRFRAGHLERLTTDHTLVQDLLEAGAITREEADRHPLGYLLNRAVGTESRVQAQILTDIAFPGDLFLLCTDGLLAVLNDEMIYELLADRLVDETGAPCSFYPADKLQEIVDELVRIANERGAPDNVTVGMLGIVAE